MQQIMRNRRGLPVLSVLLLLQIGCTASQGPGAEPAANNAPKGDELMIVDCLLPGQVRQLGTNSRYLTARRPIKTTASECAIRGGEYTAFDRADYATALKVWIEQAKLGDPEAQTYVGEIYEKGLGLPADYQVAALWYQRAAEQNFTRAQINMGNLYEKGLGVPKDPVQALNWYRKASGLNTDHLQYASSIMDSEALQSQVTSLAAEVADLQTYKTTTQAELAAERAAAEKARLQAAKANQEAAKASQQQKARELATPVGSAAVTSSAVVASGAPVIQILDPPITLTRSGPTVLLRNAVTEREVIGKVTSPNGLKSFLVNNQPVEVDDYNLFFVTVPIKTQINPVALLATDRAENSVNFSFSMFIENASPDVRSVTVTYDSKAGTASYDGIQFGRYHALIIGNQDYQYYAKLKSPEADAKTIAEVLSARYGFKTTLLLNANRYEMLTAINRLRETLTEEDNLLIYYAGHGELDNANERGFWLPVDAQPDSSANWLSNVAISDQLNTIKAKHIMVVADSCYAGTLSTASVARQAHDQPIDLQRDWIEVMVDIKARTVLTSGGISPVLDSGGGKHSVFARSFIETLNKNNQLLDGNRLFLSVLSQVSERSRQFGLNQIPDYGAIKFAGHEAGEFFLIPVI